MERKVDEIFYFNGVKLKVVDIKDKFYCDECYFYHFGFCVKNKGMIGDCTFNHRKDKTNVIFKINMKGKIEHLFNQIIGV